MVIFVYIVQKRAWWWPDSCRTGPLVGLYEHVMKPCVSISFSRTHVRHVWNHACILQFMWYFHAIHLFYLFSCCVYSLTSTFAFCRKQWEGKDNFEWNEWVESLVLLIRSQQDPVSYVGSKIDFPSRGICVFPPARQMLGCCVSTGDDRFFSILPNSVFTVTGHWTTQVMIAIKQIKTSHY